MPTYQYACTEPECGHAFEQVQSFTDDALTVCPQCQGRLRKVFNAVGVVFKGSGFYRTDSRKDGRGEGQAATSGGGSGSTDSGSTSTSGGDKPAASGTSSSSGTESSGGASGTSSATAGAGAA